MIENLICEIKEYFMKIKNKNDKDSDKITKNIMLNKIMFKKIDEDVILVIKYLMCI